uniref:Uncharacterized protein n=1 Tax=Anguilla anguilla TaxID=7936 RepID=A0A0E9TZG2_ANGAN
MIQCVTASEAVSLFPCCIRETYRPDESN